MPFTVFTNSSHIAAIKTTGNVCFTQVGGHGSWRDAGGGGGPGSLEVTGEEPPL